MLTIFSAGRVRKYFATLGLLGSGLLLSSCGGGAAAVLLSGVGSGGTGLVQGLVVGFGSVFIDGNEYTTTTATIQQDNDQGIPQNALLKLGQRVQASIDSTGTAIVTATVIPSLSGPVTLAATQDSSGDEWARVCGQWIRIVSSATHTPLGLTTVLSGVNNVGTTLSPQLGVGNEVEVHGVWSWDVAHNAYVLVASRVEVLSATPLTSNVLVGGVVSAAPTSNEVALNASSGGTILQGTLPAGLKVGQSVSAWVDRSTWNNWPGGGTPLPAATISAASLAVPSGSSNQKAQLSGLVSNYSAATNTATVQGTVVTLPTGAKVGDGDYIKLTGLVSAGVLSDTTVDQENSVGTVVTPQTIQVLGTTNGINWNAGGAITFVLQGTSVTAPEGTYASCAALTSLTTVSVTVTGTVPSPGQPVVASLVTCTAVAAPPSGSVSDFHGTIQPGSVSTGGTSLILGNEDNAFTVNWTATTYIDPALGPVGSGWSAQHVEVMGTLNGATLTAMVIRLDAHGTND
ncbi:MAG: hypothetical protein KGK17_10930 [Betaproteobacteria bacterium]|nr:hypothetical protein [Betaproteobacteria bacterium]